MFGSGLFFANLEEFGALKSIILDFWGMTWCRLPKYQHAAFCTANNTGSGARADVTGGYIVVDVERLRGYMMKISDRLMILCQLKSATNADQDVSQQPRRHDVPDPENEL
jgi:hypothetical protein